MEYVSIFETWYKNDSGESNNIATFKAKQDIYIRLVKVYPISSWRYLKTQRASR